jgi:Alpha 1,4-glycosyltransferase conserved region/Glycosyltransferase sugar-binding region containing DXD motif
VTTLVQLPTIQMFWHGARLSRVERLSMCSFLANGHAVHLYVYREPVGVPAGVEILDAGQILPADAMFVHETTGSIASFADWFRYKLLLARGGLWADTDVVCLRPLHYPGAEIFGWQDARIINNAVLGLPPAHPLAHWMVECCEHPNRLLPYDSARVRRRKLKRRFLRGNRRGDIAWGEHGPEGLTRAAGHLGYAHLAVPFWHFYPVHYLNWNAIFDESLAENEQIVAASAAIHLWNEMTRQSTGFDKNAEFPAASLFERLCRRYL